MDYRQFLKGELEKRKLKNPLYSLRAFSRDLGLSVSRLSEVLSGEDLSVRSAEKMAARLKLSNEVKSQFVGDVRERYEKRSL